MVAGAKPFEEVYKKQEAALRRVAEGLDGKLSRIQGTANSLIADMDGIKRKELYDLNAPPIDLKSFDREEKEYMAAGLYTLAVHCKSPSPSPFQKAFARSIQAYIGIKAPQTIVDLSKITSIDSTMKQKAIMQVFMEYLFLEKEDFSFLSEYSGTFKDFSVNETDREVILQAIHTIYKAVDPVGFIEKYGFVPETPDNGMDAANQDVSLEPLTIDSIFHIPAGQKKTFTAKDIRLTADIHCEGELVFDRCVVTYNGCDLKGRIRMEENSSVSFSHCTIIGKNNQKQGTEHQDKKYLVEAGYGRSCNLSIENTIFNDCISFASGPDKVCLNNCKIFYSGLPLFREFDAIFINASGSSSKMENCLIECSETPVFQLPGAFRKEDYIYRLSLFHNIRTIENCTFRNIPGNSIKDGSILKNCHFSSCRGVFDPWNTSYPRPDDLPTVITECLFEGCADIIDSTSFCEPYCMEISYCQFVGCKNKLISAGSGTTISYCEFYNCQAEEAAIFLKIGVKKNANIRHCVFDGINLIKTSGLYKFKGFIVCELARDGLDLFKTARLGLFVDECSFRHCAITESENLDARWREILNEDYKFSIVCEGNQKYDIDDKDRSVCISSNCTGLDNVNKEDCKAENVPVRYKTSVGNPIGARLDEAMIGVPGVSPDLLQAG
jgi:hypothetical protein